MARPRTSGCGSPRPSGGDPRARPGHPELAAERNLTEVLTTDGPFAEAKEHIGGFWVVEAPDLDAALALAAEGSAACRGPVEVRPFQVEPED